MYTDGKGLRKPFGPIIKPAYFVDDDLQGRAGTDGDGRERGPAGTRRHHHSHESGMANSVLENFKLASGAHSGRQGAL